MFEVDFFRFAIDDLEDRCAFVTAAERVGHAQGHVVLAIFRRWADLN
jgi:hypothetical protein